MNDDAHRSVFILPENERRREYVGLQSGQNQRFYDHVESSFEEQESVAQGEGSAQLHAVAADRHPVQIVLLFL